MIIDSSFRIGSRLRLAAATVMLRLGGRRREIQKLFALTAEAFGGPIPAPQAQGTKGLLAEYARFTRQRAETAFDRGDNLREIKHRMYRTAVALGNGYRLQLDVRTFADARAAARLIYRELGIDFRCGSNGEVEVRRCAFADVYTPRVCNLISALDQGLVAGLTRGMEMVFRQRLTEGAPACLACISGEKL